MALYDGTSPLVTKFFVPATNWPAPNCSSRIHDAIDESAASSLLLSAIGLLLLCLTGNTAKRWLHIFTPGRKHSGMASSPCAVPPVPRHRSSAHYQHAVLRLQSLGGEERELPTTKSLASTRLAQTASWAVCGSRFVSSAIPVYLLIQASTSRCHTREFSGFNTHC